MGLLATKSCASLFGAAVASELALVVILNLRLALAIRLFGNIMSGTIIIGILLSIAPLFIPVIIHVLELIIGQIQAYIFAVLAAVYIASASRVHQEKEQKEQQRKEN